MSEITDPQYPDCVCDHPWGDHQQPVDLAGECDLCDCAAYLASGLTDDVAVPNRGARDE